MRATEADKYRKAYLAADAALDAIRSPSLAIEGTSSACCDAPTFERFEEWLCVVCQKRTTPKPWASMRGGIVSRGGWTARVNGEGEPTSRIYTNETKCPGRSGERDMIRLEPAWQERARLAPHFARPATAAEPAWRRSLDAWDDFLLPGLREREWTQYTALGVAVERGRGREPGQAELWTRDNVQLWISGARRVVRDRIVDALVVDAERESRRDGPRAA